LKRRQLSSSRESFCAPVGWSWISPSLVHRRVFAVTGRIWAGATALSDDSLAIDGRLDRIRLRVEEVIAPTTAQAN